MTESERIALPLIEKLIVYRDTLKSRDDRELLADACNTISSLRATCTTLRARLALLESVLAEAKRECIMTPLCFTQLDALKEKRDEA